MSAAASEAKARRKRCGTQCGESQTPAFLHHATSPLSKARCRTFERFTVL